MPKKISFLSSLFLLVIAFSVAALTAKIYLRSREFVPAWIPPLLCPCWNSTGYFCESTGVCLTKNNPLIPTPTAVPVANLETFSQFPISSLLFSPKCELTVINTHNESPSFSLYPPSVFPPDFCPANPLSKISPSQNIAVFIDSSSPQINYLKIYFHKFQKVLTLAVFGPTPILDFEFAPDSLHLFSLSGTNTLTVFDLASLAATYPANVDFRNNVFKSSSLQTRTINLPPAPQNYAHITASSPNILVTGLAYQTLVQYPEETLYPRSSCACWDSRSNTCLLQSACLNR